LFAYDCVEKLKAVSRLPAAWFGFGRSPPSRDWGHRGTGVLVPVGDDEQRGRVVADGVPSGKGPLQPQSGLFVCLLGRALASRPRA